MKSLDEGFSDTGIVSLTIVLTQGCDKGESGEWDLLESLLEYLADERGIGSGYLGLSERESH